jgi:hypothetical protein
MPPGYEATHPEAQWLRNKSYWLGHEMADKQVRSLSPDAFRTQVLDALRALSPFCDWLREATPAAG